MHVSVSQPVHGSPACSKRIATRRQPRGRGSGARRCRHGGRRRPLRHQHGLRRPGEHAHCHRRIDPLTAEFTAQPCRWRRRPGAARSHAFDAATQDRGTRARLFGSLATDVPEAAGVRSPRSYPRGAQPRERGALGDLAPRLLTWPCRSSARAIFGRETASGQFPPRKSSHMRTCRL